MPQLSAGFPLAIGSLEVNKNRATYSRHLAGLRSSIKVPFRCFSHGRLRKSPRGKATVTAPFRGSSTNSGVWFRKRVDREIDPRRELVEELVQEHRALANLTTEDFAECFLSNDLESEEVTSRKGLEGVRTAYFHEVFSRAVHSFSGARVDTRVKCTRFKACSRLPQRDREPISRDCRAYPSKPTKRVLHSITVFPDEVRR